MATSTGYWSYFEMRLPCHFHAVEAHFFREGTPVLNLLWLAKMAICFRIRQMNAYPIRFVSV